MENDVSAEKETSGAVKGRHITDRRHYRQIRQVISYSGRLADDRLGKDHLDYQGIYLMRKNRVPKAIENLDAIMADLALVKKERDKLKAKIARRSDGVPAWGLHYNLKRLGDVVLEIADKLPPEMGVSAVMMMKLVQCIRFHSESTDPTRTSQERSTPTASPGPSDATAIRPSTPPTTTTTGE
jgi:hypothetical protein